LDVEITSLLSSIDDGLLLLLLLFVELAAAAAALVVVVLSLSPVSVRDRLAGGVDDMIIDTVD